MNRPRAVNTPVIPVDPSDGAGDEHTGEPVDKTKALARYLKHRSQQGAAPLTIKSMRYGLRAFLEHCPDDLAKTKRRHVRSWWEQLEGSAASRRTRVSQVRVFCDWLVAQRALGSNPIRDMGIAVITERRRVPRRLNSEDIARLYSVLPDARARCAITVMLQSGIRIGELVSIDLHDIDWDRGQVLVNGKTGQRWAPLPAEAQRAIREYLAELGGVSWGPLIRSYTHPDRGIGAPAMGERVREWMRAAGIKAHAYDGVSAHALRHTAATDVLERCGNIRTTQQFLGHVSVQSTEVYVAGAVSADVLTAAEGRSYAA